jgi:phosphate:Na+ symporter
MISTLDFWKVLAGTALFMFGMMMMEETLQQLAGRPFKLFLRKHTTHKLKAIGAGAVVTALLQSSSIVNLMLLAFAGSGIIQMENGLAMMLGSNIGTTFTSWIVATIGFEFNLENLALPATGIAGITMMLLNKHSKWFQLSKFFLGFSFLFVGLNFMKTGVQEMVQQTDLSRFNDYAVFLFLLLGVLITAFIQSSSATIALVLAALHAHAIELQPAMAIVLGAEIGTTIKLFIASAKGIAAKKRMALGNFLMNLTVSLLLIFLLDPIERLISNQIGITNNVLALVVFQTFVNLVSILLFYPFLEPFGKFLSARFTKNTDETLFIHKIKPGENELAVQAVEKEAAYLLQLVIDFSKHIFGLNHISNGQTAAFIKKQPEEQYELIKHLHGDLLAFYVKQQAAQFQPDEVVRLQRLMSAVRNSMYAAKSVKDAWQDVTILRNSSNDQKYRHYTESKETIRHLLTTINQLLLQQRTEQTGATLIQLYKQMIEQYTQELRELYRQSSIEQLNETEISTIINYNRELYTGYKSLLLAVKDLLLNEQEAALFDELPGFIR